MDAEQGPITIYGLCDDTGLRYIGRTKLHPLARLEQHLGATAGGRRLSAWLAALRAQGKRPTMRVLCMVSAAGAAAEERRQIVAHRAQGCDLVNGKPSGRPRSAVLTWACMLHLLADDGLELERLARRDHVPVGAVCRRLLVERLGQLDGEQTLSARAAAGSERPAPAAAATAAEERAP